MINFWKYLPAFKGKKRLIRLLCNKQIELQREITFSIDKKTIFSVPNLKENIAFELFFEGSYEKGLVHFLINKLPLNGIFIDVGANVGAISVLLGKRRPDVQIFAFEASPRVFAYLERNIVQNGINNIKAINKAIHKNDDIFLDFFSPEDKFGKGSFASVFTTVAEQVNTIRLDNYFNSTNIQPDIIKIDVEGFEGCISNCRLSSSGHGLY